MEHIRDIQEIREKIEELKKQKEFLWKEWEKKILYHNCDGNESWWTKNSEKERDISVLDELIKFGKELVQNFTESNQQNNPKQSATQAQQFNPKHSSYQERNH